VDSISVITVLVALYGALLSTYNFIVQWKDRRPRLNVKPKVEARQLLVMTTGGLVLKNGPALCVHFDNPTSWLVPVTAVFIRPNKSDPIELRQFNRDGGGFLPPFVVEPHRGVDFIIHGQGLAEKLDKAGIRNDFQAVIEAQDELDRRYRSKLIHLSTQQLLEV